MERKFEILNRAVQKLPINALLAGGNHSPMRIQGTGVIPTPVANITKRIAPATTYPRIRLA